jgi:asparagine synthase (glutamine-hydrolysing)
MGIKPIYWGFHQGVLFFGSQLKSFTAHPMWKPEIDRDALVSYFRFNYVPAPLSIFKDIYKLEAGHILTVDHTGTTVKTNYWNISDIAQKGISHRSKKTEEELVEELDALLRDAVKRRMIADVPLGAFLSGGIDSSTVVALMQVQNDRPVKTFSIGFYEDNYNEAHHAKAVAEHLGTEHHELYLHADEALSIIPSIPDWCDEPFADSSQIPTFLVSKLAREHVIVSLSGDGGDELFAGYNRYLLGQSIWPYIGVIPFWVRNIGARAIHLLSPNQWDSVAALVPQKWRQKNFGDKAHKFSNMLNVANVEHFYRMLVSLWDDPASLVVNAKEPQLETWSEKRMKVVSNVIERMQLMDSITYLPDDILTKVDRASMAVSLEGRVPLLDHRVVEFSWQLPLNMKIRRGESKWLLRQVLNKYVPKHLVDRPKMGFGVPIDQWLRGPLKEWAEGLLSENKLEAEGILDPKPIRERWKEHLSGRRNWQYSLWGVLMFQAWRERWNI